jgi:hypothetical protein
MDKRFMVLLQTSFLREENLPDETVGLSPHGPFQLVHPSLNHQRNAFMGCDCHIELCIKELKGVVGVGQSQVTKDAARVERSVAVASMAYLLLLRLRAKQIKPGTSWSAFPLKRGLAWEWGARQVKRAAHQEARKAVRLRPTAQEVPLRLAA